MAQAEPPTLDRLPPLQRAALEALWDGGPGSVYDVLERLPDDRPPYTSVLSALQRLQNDGWVVAEAQTRGKGRYYVFRATRTREEAQGGTVQRVLDAVFGGDAFKMAQQLLSSEALSAEELAALRRLIDERRDPTEEPPDV